MSKTDETNWPKLHEDLFTKRQASLGNGRSRVNRILNVNKKFRKRYNLV